MLRAILPGDDLLGQLPLPLAQLYRRALNAKTAQDRHHHAFYLAEATLKLAASLRIGIALANGLEPASPLAQALEQLCLPSVGMWVGFLRDTSQYLRKRPDAALLPLADAHDALLRLEALPHLRAFAEQAAMTTGPDEHPPLQPEQVREASRQGILGFFTLIAAYRNQVFGHGAQRLPAFYETLGPLLLEAVREVLEQDALFGGLTLAVPRWTAESADATAPLQWRGLRGLASVMLPSSAVGPEPASSEGPGRVAAGQVHFVGLGVRVLLHPLVVYLEDRTERERVGFLNRTVTRQRRSVSGGEEVRRCEYLDYATGDQLREIDARQELTRLLARLRGQPVNTDDVDRVASTSQAEPAERDVALTTGVVLGDFELEGELGRGGMGVVYRARQRSLNRQVALKVLPPSLAADTVSLARFRREITALARCEHPNLVKILTSGSDGERHYYAMELVEGANLADLFVVLLAWSRQGKQPLREGLLSAAVSSSYELAQRRRQADSTLSDGPPQTTEALPEMNRIEPGPPPPLVQGRALFARLGELFADAAEALAHLHERGVLHRDIKPGNLMLTADSRRLVLMDLGLARLDEEAGGRLTRTRQFLGTLRYASPEQAISVTTIDARSDVYSLGASLWELLALRPLYGADETVSSPELIRRIQFDDPGRIRKFRPEVPAELEAIVLKCLEKDPRRRYSSAAALIDDLDRWRRGEPVRAHRQTPWYRLRRLVRRQWRACTLVATTAAMLALIYLGLADADYHVAGGEGVRRRLDLHEASLFRPAPREEDIRRQAKALRTDLGPKVFNASPEYPGWWDAMMKTTGDPYYDSWSQGQTNAALLICPETDAATRRVLARSMLELFDPPHKQVKPFEPVHGWLLFRTETTEKAYPSCIGSAWALPALGQLLAHPENLDPDQRDQLMMRLGQVQESLDHYRARDAQNRPLGAWNLFTGQMDASRSNIYVTATVLLGLLELRQAKLSWRGDGGKVDELLRETVNWVLGQYDGRGWRCASAASALEFNDGLTLWFFALLLRAEAEARVELPAEVVAQIPRHLAECGKRPTDYPNAVALFGERFKYKETTFKEETRVIKILWYPWAVETAARWLARAERLGAPRDEWVRTRRVLGHLVITLGPSVASEAAEGPRFIAAETLIGWSALPP